MPHLNNTVCPYCAHAISVTTQDQSAQLHTLKIENADGRCTLFTTFTVCPNGACRLTMLSATLFTSEATADTSRDKLGRQLKHWKLMPNSGAKVFPAYIPEAILADYREASLIVEMSPKASATLSRRCLQGMIRNFWGVTPGKLAHEIRQIKDKVDSDTWNSIESVREIGNIGAHMENDIDLIIDVDPNEAELLIGLIETLLEDWYIARETRRQRSAALQATAAAKKLQKNP